MKKHFAILLYCLLFSTIALAQANKSRDVIYLLDGSVLKGELLKYEKGGDALIQLKNGWQRIVQDSTIERIEQEIRPKTKWKNPLEKGKLYHAFYFSGNFGSNFLDQGDWGMGMEHVTGYWLSDNISLGIGGGLLQFSSDYNWRVVPLYLDFKLKSNLSNPFYLGADVGMGFPLKNEDQNIIGGKTGERFRAGVGKVWTTPSSTSLTFELSYLHQRAQFESWAWGWWDRNTTRRNIAFKRYQLKFGVLF